MKKNFRFFRGRKRIPEVESTDKDKFFAHPNEDVLNMAVFRYMRTRAYRYMRTRAYPQKALQQFKATKRKKK